MPQPAEALRGSTLELHSLGAHDEAGTKASMRSLFVFTTRKHTVAIVTGVIFAIASSLVRPVAAILFGKVFSTLTQYASGTISSSILLEDISRWGIALTVVGASAWLLEATFLSSWMIFGELQAKCAREMVFSGMLQKNMQWYDLRTNGISALLIRIQTEIRELQLGVSQPLGYMVFETSSSIVSMGVALYFSWNLTLVIIAAFPLAALSLYIVSRPLKSAIESQKRELTLASKYANTAITQINVVKAFNGQDHEIWQYFSTIKKIASFYLTQARVNSGQFGIIKFFMVIIFVQGFWYGLTLSNQGLDPGRVVTTFYSCLAALMAVEVVLPQWLVLTKGMSAGHTLRSIMSHLQENKESSEISHPFRPNSCVGDIEINEISFAYPSNPQRLVLENVSFFFPAGETTFLVGKSGSGKSTIGNLLLKYYLPFNGSILVDSCPINELCTSWVRQNITLVQQQSVLFKETVYQNIAFGLLSTATIPKVWEAAKFADLEETLLDFKEGLETNIGGDGKTLSGGQQQRVAIARARLRDTPILILDEATSALDFTTRQKLTKSIREWRRGKTTIIITHDVSQILDSEYVYVLENGTVVQEGYPKNLGEKSDGIFASFLPVDGATSDLESSAEGLRRESGPCTTTFDAFEEDFNKNWGNIAKIFSPKESPALLSSGFNTRAVARMSFGLGAVHANAIREQSIWSSPTIPADDNQFHKASPGTYLTSPRPAPAPPSSKRRLSGTNVEALKKQATRLESGTRVDAQARNRTSTMESNLDSDFLVSETYQTQKQKTLKEIFSTIWPILVWKERAIITLGFFSAIIVACSTPTFSFLFAKLLSVFYTKEDQSILARNYSLALIGVAIVDASATFTTHYALEYAGQAWITSLRLEAMKRILAQPRVWFDNQHHTSGRLNEYLDRHAEEMRNLLGRFAGPVLTALLMVLISIVWAFTISWKLSLVALACAPVMYFSLRIFDWASSKREHKCNVAAEQTSSIFIETFTSIRVVRALTLESWFTTKHRNSVEKTFKVGHKRAFYSGVLFGPAESMQFFISALIVWYSAVVISSEELSVSQALQVIQLLLFGMAQAGATLSFVPQINSSRTTATQLLYLANLPMTSKESMGKRRLESPLPIKFRDLDFTYPSRPDVKALSGINLELKAGSCTALVGPSGGGKSTLASLLFALYPPFPRKPESLYFNGFPISDLNIASLRSHISIVPQTPILFPSSILSNILYGLPLNSPYSTLFAASAAAKEAGIHDFVMSLDQAYETQIGEGGMGLSGGQAQRVAIARAIVRKPKLLVLDEATGSLDAVNAEVVRETVRKLLDRNQNRIAVVVISHGLEMMRISNEIIMIEQGKIVERGSFEGLKAQGGKFARLIGAIAPLEDDMGDELMEA